MITVDIEPVLDFLTSLNPVVRAKVYRGIDLLANNWPLIGEPHIKRVPGCEGLWELRERYGNTQIRLFFFQAGPNILAIIHGYVKKTRKIPVHVLKQAVQKMKEYKKE